MKLLKNIKKLFEHQQHLQNILAQKMVLCLEKLVIPQKVNHAPSTRMFMVDHKRVEILMLYQLIIIQFKKTIKEK